MEETALSWLLRALGFWGLLTLVTGAVAIIASLCAVLWSPNAQTIRSFRILLLGPLAIGCLIAVVAGMRAFADIREVELPFTAWETVLYVLQSMWFPVRDAVIMTIPAALILEVGRLVRLSRDSKVIPETSATEAIKKNLQ